MRSGEAFYLWYTGAGKRGGGFGLATSADGVKWKGHGSGPVMRGVGASCDPCVWKIGDTFLMFHLGSNGKEWTVGVATSPDGMH